MLTYDLIAVTPELAREWLGFAVPNRALRRNVVTAYASDMRNGEWKDTGDPIRFRDDGALIDGQHRLNAIVLSCVTVEMIVVRGLDDEARWNINTGIPRKYHDVLRMRGVAYPPQVSAVTKRMLVWDKGIYYSASPIGRTPTHAELDDYRASEPLIMPAVANAATWHRKAILTPTVAATAWIILARTNLGDPHAFMERVSSGDHTAADDPAWTVRERLTAEAGHGRMRDEEARAMLFIAWNADVERRPLSKIQLPKGGLSNDNYPFPKGYPTPKGKTQKWQPQPGAGRRLRAEEEAKAAEMFASGATERQVAAALGVGNGTAHRVKERLAAG